MGPEIVQQKTDGKEPGYCSGNDSDSKDVQSVFPGGDEDLSAFIERGPADQRCRYQKGKARRSFPREFSE